MKRSALPPSDPVEAAKAAGLRYTSGAGPCIRRLRSGRGFRYTGTDGRPLKDADELRRVRALVIPPAWREVWICPSPRGHLQATGRDARGRKQYRYHAKWRTVRDTTKYERLIAFAEALPTMRARTSEDLARPGLPREKVIALVVQLLEKTLIRVGNDEYARDNDSFGLTTLRDRHVDVSGSNVRFEFRGKSGVEHTIDLSDRRLARIVQRCQDLPGYELFQYVDDAGERQTIDSSDVNEYLRAVTGQEFTSKDFRTWAGTVLAAKALREFKNVDSDAEGKRNVVQAIESVAKRLGNTKAVCRKCYVHPAILDAYLDGSMVEIIGRRAAKELAGDRELSAEEAAVLGLLRHRLARQVA